MPFFLQTIETLWAHLSLTAIFLWFAAGVLLVVVLHKIGWLSRRHIVHKIFCGLFYLYIPLAFLGVGITYQSMRAYEKMLYSVVDRHAQDINTQAVQIATPLLAGLSRFGMSEKEFSPQAAVEKISGEVTRGSLEQMVSYLPFLQPWLSSASQGMSKGGQMLFDLLSGTISFSMQRIVVPKVSETIGVEEKKLKEFWAADVIKSLSDGLVVSAIKEVIARHVRMIFSNLYPIFAFLLLLPFVEILFYQWWRHRCCKTGTQTPA